MITNYPQQIRVLFLKKYKCTQNANLPFVETHFREKIRDYFEI